MSLIRPLGMMSLILLLMPFASHGREQLLEYRLRETGTTSDFVVAEIQRGRRTAKFDSPKANTDAERSFFSCGLAHYTLLRGYSHFIVAEPPSGFHGAHNYFVLGLFDSDNEDLRNSFGPEDDLSRLLPEKLVDAAKVIDKACASKAAPAPVAGSPLRAPIPLARVKPVPACWLAEEAAIEKGRKRVGELVRKAMGTYEGKVQCFGVEARNVYGVGSPVCDKPRPHFVLVDLEEGSAASRAGLRDGDVVVAVNGTTVDSTSNFEIPLLSATPGQSISVTVERNGVRLQRDVTVGLMNPRSPEPRTCVVQP